MGKKSLIKGKNGEREFCRKLSKLTGFDGIERNLLQCRDGGHDVDVKTENSRIANQLRGVCIEIKRYKNCHQSDIRKWWLQAVTNAKKVNKDPVLAYRVDRQSWVCVLHIKNHFDIKDIKGCLFVDIHLFAEMLKGTIRCREY